MNCTLIILLITLDTILVIFCVDLKMLKSDNFTMQEVNKGNSLQFEIIYIYIYMYNANKINKNKVITE